MTAHADRLDGQDIREIYGKEVYLLPLPKALARKNLLAKVKYYTYFDRLTDLKRLKTSIGKVSLNSLNRRFFIPRRDEEIARIVGDKMSRVANAKGIIFCRGIKHCRHFASLLAT